jgi:hypothetical protein
MQCRSVSAQEIGIDRATLTIIESKSDGTWVSVYNKH